MLGNLNPRNIMFILASLSGFFFILALFAPIIGESLYHYVSPICHQIPARSIMLLGMPLGICTRCTGIYLGFSQAYVLLKRIQYHKKTNRLILGGSISISCVAAVLKLLDIDTDNAIRFVSGVSLGISTYFFVEYFTRLSIVTGTQLIVLINRASSSKIDA